jgi:hypothetical protein
VAFERDKRVTFDIAVALSEAAGKGVASMRVSWTVNAA